MRTFKCNFGRGVSCELKVGEKPTKGDSPNRQMLWEGNPGPWLLRPYIAWMNSINKQLSDEWDMKLMQVFIVAPEKYETWIYHPGKPPKKLNGIGGAE